MGSIPSEYLDNLKEIILSTLNRIEQLRMRVLFGVQLIKGPYDQELDFRSDGKIYYNNVEIGAGGAGLWEVSGGITELITKDDIGVDTGYKVILNGGTNTAYLKNNSNDVEVHIPSGGAFKLVTA